MSDTPTPDERACEWCGSPMAHDGRAVCPSCGRLASRLSAMEPDAADPVAPPATEATEPSAPSPSEPSSTEPAEPTAAPTPVTPREPELLGSDRPEPITLADDDGGGRRKVVIGAVVVVLLLLGGVVVALNRSGSSGSTETDTAGKTGTTLDVSGLADPREDPPTTEATTTTTEAVTTTAPKPKDGRIAVESCYFRWTMQVDPVVDEMEWTATKGDVTEYVVITSMDGVEPGSFDEAKAMKDAADSWGSDLGEVKASKLAGKPAVTTSFTGTVDGKSVVGWIISAEINDQGIVMLTTAPGTDPAALYPKFLPLPASMQEL